MKKLKIFSGLLLLTLVAGIGLCVVGCGGHEHQLTHHDSLQPDCETAGHVEYWECSDCGKYFRDSKAEEEITDKKVSIDALGHDNVLTYDSEELKYYNVCSRNVAHKTFVSDAGVSEVYAYQVSDSSELALILGKETSSTIYVKLVEDITADVEIEAGKSVSIDLNSKVLTNVEEHTIINRGTLTIKDNSQEQSGKIDNITHKKATIFNEENAEFTLESGTLTRSLENGLSQGSNGGNSYYVIVNHGEVVVNGGKVCNDGAYSSLVDNGWYKPSDNTNKTFAVMTINGGEFEGGKYTLKNDDYGVMTINGGIFQNRISDSQTTNAAGIILNWNELTIKGGEFVANECDCLIYTGYNGNAEYEKATTVIEGGSVTGKITSTNKYITATSGSYAGTLTGSLTEKEFTAATVA